MLVLTRQVGDQIFVGDDVVITIVDIRSGGKVRVGIDAPQNLDIHRGEIYEEIQRDRNATADHGNPVG